MTDYYIDYVNGLNTNTGLQYNPLTVDSTADTTHLTDAALTGMTIGNGSFVWNVTRGAGATTLAWDDGTDTLTLGTAIAGMAAGDSYYLITPYKTISQFTTAGGVRSAGDKCYIRANQTHDCSAANIEFDEDGSSVDYIYLIGCNVSQGIDPWHDNSDVRPIIDFKNSSTYYMYLYTDYWWYIKNLDFTSIYRSSAEAGILSTWVVLGLYIDNCQFHNATGTAAYALNLARAGCVTVHNCGFYSNTGPGLFTNESWGIIEGCTFSSSGTGTGTGAAFRGSEYIVKDSVFGSPTTFAYDIQSGYGANVILRNCTVNYSKFTIPAFSWGSIAVEDYNGVYGDKYLKTARAVITSSTAVIREGGSPESAYLVATSSDVGQYDAVGLHDSIEPDFKIWCTDTTTVTIYMRGAGWSSFPVTTYDLYITAEYISATNPLDYEYEYSSQELSDNTTWVGYQVTFTPATPSYVGIYVCLARYVASTGVYIDIEPVIT